MWDVAINLRRDSTTDGSWYRLKLNPEEGKALFIPEGFAHGFQTLKDSSQLLYLHSGEWFPDAETGIRWDDENINVKWPLKAVEISKRDQTLPFFLFQA